MRKRISLDRNFHFGFLSASLFIARFSRDTRGSGYKYANSGIDTMKIIVTALVTVAGTLKHVATCLEATAIITITIVMGCYT